MKLRLLLIAAALLLGLGAATVAVRYTEGIKEDLRKGTNPVEVLVTVKPAPSGLTLKELRDRQLVEVRRVPKHYVPEGALSPSADTGDKVLTINLAEGEELTAGKFESPKEAGLSSLTPREFVAITISTEEMPTLASLVKVGDHVNIIGTAKDVRGTAVVDTIVLDAPVLAVGPSLKNQEAPREGLGAPSDQSSERKNVKSITFAGTELEAEKVALFKESGSIYVSILPKSTAGDTGDPHKEDAAGDSKREKTADAGSELGGIQ